MTDSRIGRAVARTTSSIETVTQITESHRLILGRACG